MRTYTIEGPANSPKVFIDESKSLIEFTGNSTLKDAVGFYSNLMKWIVAFNSGNYKTKIINIKLLHINDSSSIWIETIIKKLVDHIPATNLEINWYNTAHNKRVLSSAQMLQSRSDVKINLI
jgi:hypothetical protein